MSNYPKPLTGNEISAAVTETSGAPEYLSEKECKNALPKGRRIKRQTRWDVRYTNYWVGYFAPELEAPPPNFTAYWYDLTLDVVKILVTVTTKGRPEVRWTEVKPSDNVPKIAVDEKTMEFLGIVDDAPKHFENKSVHTLDDFLASDDED